MMMAGDPLGAIGQSAINAGTDAIGGIINMAISKTVDFLFGDTPAQRKKLADEYYARVQTIVDNHNLPSHYGGITPQQRAMQEIDEVDNSIVEAVRNLEKAHSKSRCGVCRSSLEETINLVKKQADPIFDATDKIRAMQQLKASGKLKRDALWEFMTPEEKKMVEEVASKITKPRDFTPVPEPEPVRLMAGRPIFEGVNNDEEQVEKKPVRKAKQARKQASRARGKSRKRN